MDNGDTLKKYKSTPIALSLCKFRVNFHQAPLGNLGIDFSLPFLTSEVKTQSLDFEAAIKLDSKAIFKFDFTGFRDTTDAGAMFSLHHWSNFNLTTVLKFLQSGQTY